MQPEASPQVNPNPVKPGIFTSELWLFVVVLALLAGMVFAGDLPGWAFAAGATVAVVAYQLGRNAIKRAKAAHPESEIFATLDNILAQIPEPTVEGVIDLVAALRGIRNSNKPSREPVVSEAPHSAPAAVAPPAAPPGSGAGVTFVWYLVSGFWFLVLAGCAMTAEQRKTAWQQTGSALLSKAGEVALSTLSNAALDQLDADKKADWADSLALGLRSSTTISADDVRGLIGIWTPDKPHWQDLGAQLADVVQRTASMPASQRNEIIAQALNQAAQELRAGGLAK
jgi:hypothetical protein